MNKQRRKELSELKDMVETLRGKIEDLKEEEQGAYDNMPESLQDSERGCAMSEGLDSLQEAYDSLDTAYDALEQAIGDE